MIKKDITYPDLDGNLVTETFWFNLNEAEMAELAIGKEGKAGGFDVWIRTLIQEQDGEVLVETFKQILLKTIGERSADNKKFFKSKEIQDNFLFSNAYSVLFMEIMTDADKMTAFVNGVVPANMRQTDLNAETAVAQVMSATGSGATPEPPKDDRPEWMKDPNRVPTADELKGATHDQMVEAFRRQSRGAGPVTQESAPES